MQFSDWLNASDLFIANQHSARAHLLTLIHAFILVLNIDCKRRLTQNCYSGDSLWLQDYTSFYKRWDIGYISSLVRIHFQRTLRLWKINLLLTVTRRFDVSNITSSQEWEMLVQSCLKSWIFRNKLDCELTISHPWEWCLKYRNVE